MFGIMENNMVELSVVVPIYNEREKMFKQGNYEEVQFRDYGVLKDRYYSEIKEKFFEELNSNVKNTIEDSFSNIELYMKNYFNEKKIVLTVE